MKDRDNFAFRNRYILKLLEESDEKQFIAE
jgi:hypothetical protein